MLLFSVLVVGSVSCVLDTVFVVVVVVNVNVVVDVLAGGVAVDVFVCVVDIGSDRHGIDDCGPLKYIVIFVSSTCAWGLLCAIRIRSRGEAWGFESVMKG